MKVEASRGSTPRARPAVWRGRLEDLQALHYKHWETRRFTGILLGARKGECGHELGLVESSLEGRLLVHGVIDVPGPRPSFASDPSGLRRRLQSRGDSAAHKADLLVGTVRNPLLAVCVADVDAPVGLSEGKGKSEDEKESVEASHVSLFIQELERGREAHLADPHVPYNLFCGTIPPAHVLLGGLAALGQVHVPPVGGLAAPIHG